MKTTGISKRCCSREAQPRSRLRPCCARPWRPQRPFDCPLPSRTTRSSPQRGFWYDLFLPRLKAATGDQLAIQFFPDNQLGQEADVINQVKLGVVDAMLVGTSIWANIVPEWGVLDLGYLFNDYDHLRRAQATPQGQALSDLLVSRANTHFPSWGRNLGARNFLTKSALRR